jgi:hypothetical protein
MCSAGKGYDVVVVKLDGTGNEGIKGRLQDKDAAALRAKGFDIHPGNLVEWYVLPDAPELLAGWYSDGSEPGRHEITAFDDALGPAIGVEQAPGGTQGAPSTLQRGRPPSRPQCPSQRRRCWFVA